MKTYAAMKEVEIGAKLIVLIWLSLGSPREASMLDLAWSRPATRSMSETIRSMATGKVGTRELV